MFSATSLLPVIRARSERSFSMSAPFLPMTTPGRAECRVMRAFFAGRSITTRAMPAWARRSVRYFFSARSSWRSFA